MLKTKIIIIFLLFFSNILYSQVPNNQDCAGAIPVCQAVYSQTNSFVGVGNIPGEITGSLSCLSGEVNGVWYTFTVQQSGNLCFSITPNVLSEDYDWAVYNLTNNNCSDIASMQSLDVSCNFSGASGVTGANGLGGSQNNPCIPMISGQTYVLYVSNWSNSPNGYTLNLAANGGTAVIFDNVQPSITNITNFNLCNSLTTIPINFSENVLCSSVNATDFQLVSLTNGQTFSFSNAISTLCNQGASYDNSYTFNLSTPITQTDSFVFCVVNTNAVDLCGNPIGLICDTFNVDITNNITVDFNIQDVNCSSINGGSIMANAQNGLGPYTYQWNTTPIQMGPNLNNLSPGQYIVNVTDGNGCGGQGIATVVDISTPIIENITVNNTTCGLDNGSAVINPSGGFPPYTISGIPNLNNLSPGNYNITITDSVNCIVNSSFYINGSNKPDIRIMGSGLNTIICFDDSLILSAIGAQSYTWQPNIDISNISGNSVVVNPDGFMRYYVEGTIPGGCTNIDSIDVKRNDKINIKSDKTEICPGESIRFYNDSIGLWNNCKWFLNDVENSNICIENLITFNFSGFNSIYFGSNDIYGCPVKSDTIGIIVNLKPISNFIPNSNNISILEPIVSFTNLSIGGSNYNWIIEDSVFSNLYEPNYHFLDTGTYIIGLEVINEFNCKDTNYVEIFVNLELVLYIPNAFTPNGDGLNDYFYIIGENLDLYDIKFSIFNRWGEMIFNGDGNSKWDGKFHGNTKVGGYVWKIDISGYNFVKSYYGSVILLE